MNVLYYSITSASYIWLWFKTFEVLYLPEYTGLWPNKVFTHIELYHGYGFSKPVQLHHYYLSSGVVLSSGCLLMTALGSLPHLKGYASLSTLAHT